MPWLFFQSWAEVSVFHYVAPKSSLCCQLPALSGTEIHLQSLGCFRMEKMKLSHCPTSYLSRYFLIHLQRHLFWALSFTFLNLSPVLFPKSCKHIQSFLTISGLKVSLNPESLSLLWTTHLRNMCRNLTTTRPKRGDVFKGEICRLGCTLPLVCRSQRIRPIHNFGIS